MTEHEEAWQAASDAAHTAYMRWQALAAQKSPENILMEQLHRVEYLSYEAKRAYERTQRSDNMLRVMEAYAPEKPGPAMDILYDFLDELLLGNFYNQVDLYLDDIDVANWPVVLLIGALTITFYRRKNLERRPAFFVRVKERLTKEDPSRVEALLEGLE